MVRIMANHMMAESSGRSQKGAAVRVMFVDVEASVGAGRVDGYMNGKR
jgi:hypothetical protein